jgi:hypothetical protein
VPKKLFIPTGIVNHNRWENTNHGDEINIIKKVLIMVDFSYGIDYDGTTISDKTQNQELKTPSTIGFLLSLPAE